MKPEATDLAEPPGATSTGVPVPSVRPETTRAADRVSFAEKAALGSGYLALYYGYAGIKVLAIPVYQMKLGVDPIIFGVALAIPCFWDAVTDPVVGMVSDNCHSRFGRRKPIIILGALLQALAFGLIWTVPTGLGQSGTVAYLIGTLLVFYTCFSVYSVPMMSLTYEMTPDYQERTRVGAYCGFFWKTGELTCSWAFVLASSGLFASVVAGVRSVGWLIGLAILGLVGMLPGLFVRERYFKKAVAQQRVRIGPAVKAVFTNRAFAVLVGLTICQVIAGMLASNIDHYLLVYNVCGGDVALGSRWKSVLSTGYAVIGIGSIYPIRWMANRYGKQTTLAAIFGLVLLGSFGKWFLFTPGNPWKILLDPLLCGPIWTALAVLTPSMLADVCDDDELRHGLRREGTLGALFSWIQKSGYGLAFLGAFVALDLTGFKSALGGAQPAGVTTRLRLILTISTAAWALIAIALLYLYPLTKSRAYQIRDELEARRGRI
ncbi:MAG TPA: MFS transporter [Candidatus Didemnitutus sp.]|nr:MFS transporter [Candidatus Didemnitutus sp.]